MMDLFEHAARSPVQVAIQDVRALEQMRYPHAAGYKDRDTSKEAAAKVDASRLRASCLRALGIIGAATSDAVADYLDESVLSIRPRFTELLHMGKIIDTGERRPNASGRRAKVWAKA